MFRKMLLLMGASLLIAGCSGQDPVSSAGHGEPAAKLTMAGRRAGGTKEPVREAPAHELRFDQPLRVGELEITWMEVSDSRCPLDVTCVWEGEVRVVLGITGEQERLDRVELVLNGAIDGGVAVENRGYEIRLMDVRPYPREGVEVRRDEYVAILHINRSATAVKPSNGLTVSQDMAGGEWSRPKYAALKAALARNRARWQALEAENYRFEFQRLCFCPPEYTRPALLKVESGAITSAEYADDGKAVSQQVQEHYRTVEGLFEEIEKAIAQKAAQIEVRYDAQSGMPTSIYIDQDQLIADEEQHFVAGRLEVL
jgi:hypothetical protein